MTDDRNTSGSSAGASDLHFIVEHEGKVYRAAAVEELDPEDQEIQSVLRDAGEGGRAVPFPPAEGDLSFKSAGQPQSFANIQPENATSAPQTFANINPKIEGGTGESFANIDPDRQ